MPSLPKNSGKVNATLLVLLVLAIVVVVLKVGIESQHPSTVTNSINRLTEFDSSPTNQINQNQNQLTVRPQQISQFAPNSQVSRAITDETEKQQMSVAAKNILTNLEQLGNGGAGLADDNPFVKTTVKTSDWDVFNWFSQEKTSAQNELFQIETGWENSGIKLKVSDKNDPAGRYFSQNWQWPAGTNIPQQTMKGNYLVYQFADGTKVYEEVQAKEISQAIVLPAKSASDVFVFALDYPQDYQLKQLATGEIILYDAQNKPWIYVPQAIMTDAGGNSIYLPVSLADDKQHITYILDQDWLTQASYPVVIKL
jgi:hypothetical protein